MIATGASCNSGSRTRAATTGQSGHHRQQTRVQTARASSRTAGRAAAPAPLDVHVQGAAPEKAGIVEPDPRAALGAERERGAGLPPTRRRAHHEDRVALAGARHQAACVRGTDPARHLGHHEAHAVEQRRDHGGPAGGGNPPDHREPIERHPRLARRERAEGAVEVDGGRPLPDRGDRGRELEGDRGGPCSRDVALDAQHRAAHEGAAGDQLAQIAREPDGAVAGEDDGLRLPPQNCQGARAPQRRVGEVRPRPWTGDDTEHVFGRQAGSPRARTSAGALIRRWARGWATARRRSPAARRVPTRRRRRSTRRGARSSRSPSARAPPTARAARRPPPSSSTP